MLHVHFKWIEIYIISTKVLLLEKEDIIKYMQNVIAADKPNAETLSAFKEVEQMKADNSIWKAYNDVDEMMEDLLKWNTL